MSDLRLPRLKVKSREVYGRTLYYPACPRTSAFVRLTGRKTLSQSDIEILREAGFEFDYLLSFEDSETDFNIKKGGVL